MPKRILIADDNPNMRHVMRLAVDSRREFEVCDEASDGLDAIEKALALKPDLIILDLQMPRMGGIQAAHVLVESLPDVPIILFTMHKDVLHESALANTGIKAVLSKTDGIGSLFSELNRLLL